MTLNSGALGLAAALVAGFSWIICSSLIAGLPGPMLQMSGAMMHSDLQMAGWRLGWGGFFTGLVLWSAIAGAYVWATAGLYNRLVK